jgi:hypothetical protein
MEEAWEASSDENFFFNDDLEEGAMLTTIRERAK